MGFAGSSHTCLEEDWDFEVKTTGSLEQETEKSIRERLEKELIGDEPPDQVEKRVKRIVREELDIEPRRVTVAR